MANLRALFKSGVGVFALIFLMSCATVEPPPQQGNISGLPLKQNEGVIFGVLNAASYDSRGKLLPKDSGQGAHFLMLFGPSSDSFLTRKLSAMRSSFGHASGRELEGHTQFPEVFFAKALPAGEYSIFTLRARSGEAITNVTFVVSPNRATYIGSLQVEFHGARGLFGEERSAQRVAIKVLNEFEKATQLFKQHNPSLEIEVISNPAIVK